MGYASPFLFLCVWVWWLQLTALQSERLLLLGELQYSEPPATGLVWINFLRALVLTPRPLTFCWNYHWCAVSSCKARLWSAGWERGRAGDMGRTEAQQRQRAEIASEEVHSQNNIVFPAFYWLPRGSLYLSLVESQLSGFAREQRVCLVDSSWRVTKKALFRGPPFFSPFWCHCSSKIHLFIFLSE